MKSPSYFVAIFQTNGNAVNAQQFIEIFKLLGLLNQNGERTMKVTICSIRLKNILDKYEIWGTLSINLLVVPQQIDTVNSIIC